jgi:hypothetical protein
VQTEKGSAFVQTNPARRFESAPPSAMLRLGPHSLGGSRARAVHNTSLEPTPWDSGAFPDTPRPARLSSALGNKMNMVRWLAVIPTAFVAWYAVFLLGMGIILTIGTLCPAEEMVSGSCVAWWAYYAEHGAFIFCAGLAAFLVVVGTAVVAPTHRKHVAVVSFILGAAIAVYMTQPWSGTISVFPEFLTAILAGLLGVGVVVRWLHHTPLPNKPLEPTR